MDDIAFPPDPTTMPNAAEWNTKGRCIVALGRVVANAIVSVAYANGAPVVAAFTAAPEGVATQTFTLQRAVSGAPAGDVTIHGPPGTFPEPVTQPSAVCINVAGAPAAWSVSAVNVASGVRAITAVAGVAADVPFTVAVP